MGAKISQGTRPNKKSAGPGRKRGTSQIFTEQDKRESPATGPPKKQATYAKRYQGRKGHATIREECRRQPANRARNTSEQNQR
jgi:hypothetical protein